MRNDAAEPFAAPAVFLDRDGTIIEDRGHLRHPSEAVFYDGTAPALKMLQQAFQLFIVTNQPGVAMGQIRLDEVDRVNESVLARLAQSGIRMTHVYCCPHQRSDECPCIKPNPHFLHEASRTYGIDLARSFVIGDHPHDVEFARRGGATGIYVLTGHGEKHRADLPDGSLVATDIREAAKMAVDAAAHSST